MGRGVVKHDLRGREKLGIVFKDLKKELCRQRGLSKGSVFPLWASVSLSMQEGMEGIPGSQSYHYHRPLCSRRNLGEQWGGGGESAQGGLAHTAHM